MTFSTNPMRLRNMEYESLDGLIKRSMRRSAAEVVELGYYLRRMADERLYEVYYSCFDSYLQEELHMDYTMANRFMGINKRYSIDGQSEAIDEKYADYSQGVLIEMLSMPPELAEQVTPDMTVKQVREIKRQAKRKKAEEDRPEAVETAPEHADDTVVDGKYREIEEDGEVATSQPEEDVHDRSWFVRQYVKEEPSEAVELFEICRKEKNNSDRAKAIQKHIAPYGCHCSSCSEYDFSFHGFAGGMDFRIGEEKQHLKYGALAEELMKIIEEQAENEEPVPAEMRSAYGLTKTVYPEGSLLTTKGCGNKYDCFSCAQDCAIRQEDRYCREAPMGSPFGCTTMKVIENLKEEMGEGCQFVNNSLAYHTSGSNEADPCCKDCQELSCGYRCQRSLKLEEPSKIPELVKPDKQQRGYLNAFARYFISCKRDWMQEDFQNRVADVSKSPEEIKKHLGEGSRKWFFTTNSGVSSINLFDDYVQLWDEDDECLGDFEWSYLAVAIQRMWNESALKELTGTPEPEEPVQEAETVEEVPEEEALEDELTEIRRILEKEKKMLDEYLTVDGLPKRLMFRQKTIVGALAAMISDLDRGQEEEKPEQPELPAMKNNKEREAFLDAYAQWPVWIDIPETGERYYRYVFPNGASFVLKVYFHRCFDYKSDAKKYEDRFKEDWGSAEYYLMADNKHFKDCQSNRTSMVEFLKNYQKKGRAE